MSAYDLIIKGLFILHYLCVLYVIAHGGFILYCPFGDLYFIVSWGFMRMAWGGLYFYHIYYLCGFVFYCLWGFILIDCGISILVPVGFILVACGICTLLHVGFIFVACGICTLLPVRIYTYCLWDLYFNACGEISNLLPVGGFILIACVSFYLIVCMGIYSYCMWNIYTLL